MKKLGNVFILGDSYTTFEKYIPDYCGTFYSPTTHTDIGVNTVEQTWWHMLLQNTESKLIMNNSYSGTTICDTGYSAEDCSKTNSFNARITKLINESFFKNNQIDTFIIFGGTNDFWAESPVGELNYGEKTSEDLYSVLPAFCHLVETIKVQCPNAKIVTVINHGFSDVITNGLIEGSRYYNIKSILLNDMDKISGHPTPLGMQQIFEQILNEI